MGIRKRRVDLADAPRSPQDEGDTGVSICAKSPKDLDQAEQELEERPAVDSVYKEDIPASRRALEELKKQFSGFDSRTDWSKLRIEPLLEHARTLERLLRSPKFSRETSRLTRGVVMFHSDLVYFRENLKALKVILKAESKSNPAKSGNPAGRRTKPVSMRNRA